MNRPIPRGRQAIVLLVLLFLSAALSTAAAVPPAEAAHQVTLPIILAPSGIVLADNEAELRAAIAEANAAGQPPRIELQADIALTQPLPPFDNPGASATVLRGNGHTLDGNGHGPILTVGLATAVVIEQLTITNGHTGQCGGAILVYGDLTLRRSQVQYSFAERGGGICVLSDGGQAAVRLEASRVSDNAARYGGGIYVRSSGGGASLWVVDSTVASNRATGDYGGGIHAYATTGALGVRITRSTISFNVAPNAAGLFNLGTQDAPPSTRRPTAFATTIIENSTFSGNVAAGQGGAIGNYTIVPIWPDRGSQWPAAGASTAAAVAPLPPGIGFGLVKVFNSTITGNQAAQGSGIFNGELGQVELTGTIVAGNSPDGGDCAAFIASGGYNLDGDGTCGLGASTDLPEAEADLQPLASWPPGLTATHALGPTSAARDRIPAGQAGCTAAATDQRGVPRPQPAGGLCDIGAYEAEQP